MKCLKKYYKIFFKKIYIYIDHCFPPGTSLYLFTLEVQYCRPARGNRLILENCELAKKHGFHKNIGCTLGLNDECGQNKYVG